MCIRDRICLLSTTAHHPNYQLFEFNRCNIAPCLVLLACFGCLAILGTLGLPPMPSIRRGQWWSFIILRQLSLAPIRFPNHTRPTQKNHNFVHGIGLSYSYFDSCVVVKVVSGCIDWSQRLAHFFSGTMAHRLHSQSWALTVHSVTIVWVVVSSIHISPWTHEDYRGELINSFVFCQPITDVYCGQLTNES